jgi:multidrug resistance efflux pump
MTRHTLAPNRACAQVSSNVTRKPALDLAPYPELRKKLAAILGEREAYLADAMRTEYTAIIAGGFQLQVERDRVADIYGDLNQRVTSEPGLKGDFDKAKELYALKWLRAPVSGLVQEVDATTVGQVVTSAQSLVTIVPDGAPLIIEATVTNEDIGYLKVGQPVEVKVDTFPFQKYGSLKGALLSVSPDVEDKSAASRDADTRAGAAGLANRLEARRRIRTPGTSTRSASARSSSASSSMARRGRCSPG